MKIKIKRLPKAKEGGTQMFGMPYAGVLSVSPFGAITSDTDDLEKNVNDSIKPIDSEDANIEAEKGEVLFKFDAGGIFKIKGKKHSQGGTPLKVDQNDFIFSDNKNLAIGKTDAEDFEIKLSRKKKDNTPAKVLEREIDIKLYNKFVNILNDPKSDKYAIATAELMLKKYQHKIGQIAFIQETKKDLPKGLPDFVEGTAPVYSQEIEDAKTKAPQFALGGQYWGGGNVEPIDPYKGGKTKQGRTTPTGKDNAYNRNLTDYIDQWRTKGLDINYNTPNSETQSKVYDYLLENNPDEIRKMWKENGNTAKGLKIKGLPKTFDDAYLADPNNLKNLKNAYVDGLFGRRQLYPGSLNKSTVTSPTPEDYVQPPVQPAPPAPAAPLTPTNIPNVPQLPFQGFDIGMNANEALSVASPYLFALAQPTYYDMLQQKHTPDIRLDRLNNTDDISNINQGRSLAQREMFANMDDRTAALAAGSSQVNADRAIMSSNANLRNANTQIANQESIINFNKDASDNDYNLAHVQETYRNNILSDQRRNEALTNGAISSINNMNAVQKNLDVINQGLTRSVLPYLTNAYYDKDGNYLGQGDIDEAWKDKVAYSQQMTPMTVNRNRMPIPTGFGSLNSVHASGNDSYQKAIQSIGKDLNDPDPKVRALAAANYIKLYKPNNKEQSPYDEITASMYRGLGITE